MKRYFALVVLVAVGGGCDALLGPAPTVPQPGLKAFESNLELREYISEQVAIRGSQTQGAPTLDRGGVEDVAFIADGSGGFMMDQAVGAPLPAMPAAGVSGGSGADIAVGLDAAVAEGGEAFSQTTTQEIGVDEADVVKTDGTYVYIVSHGQLSIVRADALDRIELIAQIEVEGRTRDLYLSGDRAIILTEHHGGFFLPFIDVGEPVFSADDGSMGTAPSVDIGDVVIGVADADAADAVADVPPGPLGFRGGLEGYERPWTQTTIIDVSAVASPAIVSTTRIDGILSSSRMIDGELHLVLSNSRHEFAEMMPMMGISPAMMSQATMTEDDVDLLLPSFTQTDASGVVTAGPLFTWDRLYRPDAPDGFGVVSIVSIKTLAPEDLKAVGVVAEPGLIYASTESLYLTNTEYDFSGGARESTDVFKFAFGPDGPVPVAAGAVPGRVLNQYSMSEYEGHLRLATTVGPRFGRFGLMSEASNQVHVLKQDGSDLVRTGGIENIAPNETIQAARFVGDRGFLVTFRQIDPLFTLDLSDPTAPSIVGELKVPGFSTFLVPMDEHHLLAVGEYIPDDGFSFARGVQLSIFDISDFAHPVLKHQKVIGGDSGAYSEALHNPKAFTYFAETGLVALPVSIFERRFFEPGFPGGPFDLGVDVVRDVGGVAAPDDVAPDPRDDFPVPEFFVPQGFDGLLAFGVSTENGFETLGRMSTRFQEAGRFFFPSFTRGVFIHDLVLGVTDNGLRAAPIDAMDQAAPPLIFADPTLTFLGGGRPFDVAVIDVEEEEQALPGRPVGSGADAPGPTGLGGDDRAMGEGDAMDAPGDPATATGGGGSSLSGQDGGGLGLDGASLAGNGPSVGG